MRLKNWWSRKFGKQKTNATDERLQHYNVDGVDFYVFRDPRLLPWPRNQVYSFSLSDYAERIAHADILEYTKAMRDALNNGELASASELNGYLESILLLDHYAKPHYTIAGASILLEDEPTNEIVRSFQDRKKELCESSDKIDSFFLSNGIILAGNTETQSDFTKVLTYLRNPMTQNLEKAFLQKLGMDKYSGFYKTFRQNQKASVSD